MRKILCALLGIFGLFIIPAHAALPTGYTQLEYIESTGTQYIDTGIVPNQDTSVRLDAQYLNYNSGSNGLLFGARTSSNANVYVVQRLTAGNWNMGYNDNSVIVGTADTNRHIFYKNKQYQYLDGELKGTGVYSAFTCPGTAILFGFNDNGTPTPTDFPAKVYSLKIYENDTLVRDFVPAKNSFGVIGMYDTVGERFYENAGSGSFIAGPIAEIKVATTKYVETEFGGLSASLAAAVATVNTVVTNTINQAASIATLQSGKQTRPAGDTECPAGKKCLLVEGTDGKPHWYEIVEPRIPAGFTELEYIKSTGRQYIDTGIMSYKNTDIVKTKINPSSIAGTFFVTFQNPSDGAPNMGLFINDTAQMMYQYGTAPRLSKYISSNTDYVIEATNGRMTINNETISRQQIAEITINNSLCIGAACDLSLVDSRRFQGRIYYFRYEDKEGNVLFDGIPCYRNSDNAIGMYDLADPNPATAFHTNAGTGEFTAGPVVE